MEIIRLIFVIGITFMVTFVHVHGQSTSADSLDSDPTPSLKILHAEPLYIDLIRDLGARKGEKEWNVGMGMTDRLRFDSYEFLVEYEWAIIDRLGLEVELPVTVFTQNENGAFSGTKPSSRVESLKLATQYTFLVSERFKTSLALGAITEFEFTDLDKIQTDPTFKGILYNPFFIAAKRWGTNFHSLIYTGPRISTHFNQTGTEFKYELNSNFHYMIPGSRNFVGIEFNKLFEKNNFDMVIRPQMRLVINEGLMLGIVPGIPVSKERERLSVFMRLIYEPGHLKSKHDK